MAGAFYVSLEYEKPLGWPQTPAALALAEPCRGSMDVSMALVSTDFADAGRIVPKDESFVALHARKGGPAQNLIESRAQGLAVLAAVLTLHTGILAILNRFDFNMVNLAAFQEIPVDLVAAIPTPEPKAPDPQPKAAEAGKPQENPPAAPQAAEKPKPPEAVAPQQPKPEPPPATQEAQKPEPPKPEPPKAEAQKPEPPKPEAQKPEPPKPEPQKPEAQRPEPQKADARKPAKSDNRKTVAKPPEPAKTTAANRAKQDPAQPQAQAALRPEQPKIAADMTQQQPKPAAEAAQQQAKLPAEGTTQQLATNEPVAPLRFSIAPDSFRAMALPRPADDGDDPMSYTMLVFSRLELSKKYPEAAFTRGARGSAGIGFTLDEQGNVLDAELLVSSGDADLDEESVALVHRAAPFPPPPPGAKRRFDAVVTFEQKRMPQAN
jgi:TonB family protein